MPFLSRAQWRACFASERRGKSWGKKSCREWTRGVKYASLPERVVSTKRKTSRKISPKRKTNATSRRKVTSGTSRRR